MPLSIAWLFQRPPKKNEALLSHDVREMYYACEHPQALPFLESREGIIDRLREIDDAIANVVRMEGE